jgi:hypothetical protein
MVLFSCFLFMTSRWVRDEGTSTTTTTNKQTRCSIKKNTIQTSYNSFSQLHACMNERTNCCRCMLLTDKISRYITLHYITLHISLARSTHDDSIQHDNLFFFHYETITTKQEPPEVIKYNILPTFSFNQVDHSIRFDSS